MWFVHERMAYVSLLAAMSGCGYSASGRCAAFSVQLVVLPFLAYSYT